MNFTKFQAGNYLKKYNYLILLWHILFSFGGERLDLY